MSDKHDRPVWIESWVNDDFEQAVEQAIESAEQSCDLDFFPLVMKESTSFGHVFPLLSLFLVCVYVMFLQVLPWPYQGLALLAIHFGLCVVIALLAHALSELPWLKHHLTARADQTISVDIAAKLAYFENNIHVHDSILIYVSLVERKVLLLCNEKVMSKVDQSILDQALNVCSQALKQGSVQTAIKECLKTLSTDLHTVFPPSDQPVNRLNNQALLQDSAKPKK